MFPLNKKTYRKWLKSLKVGDKVKAHYDGKFLRGCVGEVIQIGEFIRVKFQRCDKSEIIEIDFKSGVGYDDYPGSLMKNMGFCKKGDYYSLGPIDYNPYGERL